MDKILLNLLLPLIVKLIAKWGKAFDVEKVKADLKPKIENFIPGKFFDEYAVAFCNKTLDIVKGVVASSDVIEKIVSLVAAKKFIEAIEVLKDALSKLFWNEQSPYARVDFEAAFIEYISAQSKGVNTINS